MTVSVKFKSGIVNVYASVYKIVEERARIELYSFRENDAIVISTDLVKKIKIY